MKKKKNTIRLKLHLVAWCKGKITLYVFTYFILKLTKGYQLKDNYYNTVSAANGKNQRGKRQQSGNPRRRFSCLHIVHLNNPINTMSSCIHDTQSLHQCLWGCGEHTLWLECHWGDLWQCYCLTHLYNINAVNATEIIELKLNKW